MYVVGTAGHVDHGKSTLVEALTGIDPDRFSEEKERGMTIDLGFAWLLLPSGNEVSIVDVPGHERFINNMLAGVGGIDLALLVVAADESVMPQTREHLAILDLLQVKEGLVVVTKKDLVENDWLELVVNDVKELKNNTVLEKSPVVVVSATTGEGLPELVSIMDDILQKTEMKRDLGHPRLPVDRSFMMPGFGTVVTGTLIDGKLNVGQEVELVLSGRKTRIRGIQSHRNKLQQAFPGSRVAANLTNVPCEEVIRGEVLAMPGSVLPTTAIDVNLRVISEAPRNIRHNMFVTVHTGSSETVARLRLLDSQIVEPGDTTWAQLKLNTPLVAARGDYFVVRSNMNTLGGGHIVDSHARRHRRGYLPVLERLAVMENGSDREVLLKTIEMSEPSQINTLVRSANLDPESARAELEIMASENLVINLGVGAYYYTATGWETISRQAHNCLEAYHQKFPLRKGASKEELRSRLGMPSQVFNAVIPRLQEDGVVVEEGAFVRLFDHLPELTNDQKVIAEGFLKLLNSNPYSPSTDSLMDPEMLNLLVDEGSVIKVSESVVFSASAYREMVDRISVYIKERGKITVADVRDIFGTSRKYALALMEHLDHQRITRRVGDARVLR